MLHCFKRFTKAAGSSWKEGHIGNSGVGKRVISTLIVFLMVFSLVQGFNSNVHAAAGVNTIKLEILSDGRLHFYGTGTANKAGTGGSIAPGGNGIVYYGEDGRSGYLSDLTRTMTWHNSSYTTYDFHAYGYVPKAQKYYFSYRVLDYTSGAVVTYYANVGSANSMYNVTKSDPTPSIPGIGSNSVTPGDGYVSVRVWTGGTNGAPAVKYTFRYSTDGGSTYKDYVICTKENQYQTATITGLKNGVTVTYYLVYQNTYGTNTAGPYTVTPGTASAPTNLKTEPLNGGYVFTWDPPTDYRGGTLQNWVLWHRRNTYLEPTHTTAAGTRTITQTGLTNGTHSGTYSYFAVAAKTNYGIGVPASMPNVWIGSPQSVKAPTVTKSSTERKLTVSWTAPANNGSAITKYEVLAGSTVIGTTTGATSGTFTWPADLTTYAISVRATNANGTGPNYYSSSVKTNGVPAAPTLSSVAATGLDGLSYMLKYQGKHNVSLGVL